MPCFMNSDIITVLTNFVEDRTSLIHFDVEVCVHLPPGFICETGFVRSCCLSNYGWDIRMFVSKDYSLLQRT